MTDEQIDALVEYLFTDGGGERVDRLVLTQDRALRHLHLGGWCREAVHDAVAKANRGERLE
jgi:hypothetical protein